MKESDAHHFDQAWGHVADQVGFNKGGNRLGYAESSFAGGHNNLGYSHSDGGRQLQLQARA
jgi:hypothetical protein